MSNEKGLPARRRQTDCAAGRYDFILIDCPPSLNSCNQCDGGIGFRPVPLQVSSCLEGLSQLMLTIREIRGTANPTRIEVVLTMFDRRNNLSQQVEADARENLGDLVFEPSFREM